MAWQVRGRRRYYYRSRRGPDGKVKKEYVGKGIKGSLAEAGDEATRVARRIQREEIQAIDNAVASLKALMLELETGAREMTHGVLLAAGFHQHRGNWRKRRGKT